MKLFYFLVPIIFLFIIGCSSTYRVTNYPSIEKFTEDVNSSMKNRDVNVITVDSSFISSAGSEIKDNLLQTFSYIKEEKISLKDVKSIKYFGKAYEEPSAYVWLESGKELIAENIQKLPNSLIQLRNISISSGYIPIGRVKEISYKTRWQSTLVGIPAGFFGGAALGLIVGASGIIRMESGGMEIQSYDRGMSTLVGIIWGSLIGTVTGIIWGAIAGWDHIYLFNN